LVVGLVDTVAFIQGKLLYHPVVVLSPQVLQLEGIHLVTQRVLLKESNDFIAIVLLVPFLGIFIAFVLLEGRAQPLEHLGNPASSQPTGVFFAIFHAILHLSLIHKLPEGVFSNFTLGVGPGREYRIEFCQGFDVIIAGFFLGKSQPQKDQAEQAQISSLHIK